MAGFGGTLYHLIFKRTSTFTLAVLGTTFFFERTFDVAADKIFDSVNKGKLWEHIKHKYE